MLSPTEALREEEGVASGQEARPQLEAGVVAKTHKPGRILAGIERQVAFFRASPDAADATPQDVLLVADQAANIDAQLSILLAAAHRVLAWSDRQGGRIGIPEDAADELRAAIAKAEGQS